MTDAIDVAYDPRYLDWVLDRSHPTNVVCAQLAVELLEGSAEAEAFHARSVFTIGVDRHHQLRVGTKCRSESVASPCEDQYVIAADPTPVATAPVRGVLARIAMSPSSGADASGRCP